MRQVRTQRHKLPSAAAPRTPPDLTLLRPQAAAPFSEAAAANMREIVHIQAGIQAPWRPGLWDRGMLRAAMYRTVSAAGC